MHRRSDLHTGVAYDNFDLFVETLPGKKNPTTRLELWRKTFRRTTTNYLISENKREDS